MMFRKSKKRAFKLLTVVFAAVLLGCFSFTCFANDVNPNMTNIREVCQPIGNGNGYMFNYTRVGSSTTPIWSTGGATSTYAYKGIRPGIGMQDVRAELRRPVTTNNVSLWRSATDYIRLDYSFSRGSGFDFASYPNDFPLCTALSIPFVVYDMLVSIPGTGGGYDVNDDVKYYSSFQKINVFISYWDMNVGDDAQFYTKTNVYNIYAADLKQVDSGQNFINAGYNRCYSDVINLEFNKPIKLAAIRMEFVSQIECSRPLSQTQWTLYVEGTPEEAVLSNLGNMIILPQYNTIFGYSDVMSAFWFGRAPSDDLITSAYLDSQLNNSLEINSSYSDLNSVTNAYGSGISLVAQLLTKLNNYSLFNSLFVVFGSVTVVGAFIGVAVTLSKKKDGE